MFLNNLIIKKLILCIIFIGVNDISIYKIIYIFFFFNFIFFKSIIIFKFSIIIWKKNTWLFILITFIHIDNFNKIILSNKKYLSFGKIKIFFISSYKLILIVLFSFEKSKYIWFYLNNAYFCNFIFIIILSID